MDFIKDIQRAIDYVEENIFKPISYEDVANHLYMSKYHFHKMFSMVVGITVNEYIRNRRLSMSGLDLTHSKDKIIDIAYKYGYTSPESFSKAFTRFHGISPNMARRSGAQLKFFDRLYIRIILEGGSILDYRIERKEGFRLLSKVRTFDNKIIADDKDTSIGDFWTECKSDDTFNILESYASNESIYGVCGPISKESDQFKYGIAVDFKGEAVPEGYTLWYVKESHWAVFKCKSMDSMGEVWDRIFKEFLPGSEYNMMEGVDFELYNVDDCFCEIHIPVMKKSTCI